MNHLTSCNLTCHNASKVNKNKICLVKGNTLLNWEIIPKKKKKKKWCKGGCLKYPCFHVSQNLGRFYILHVYIFLLLGRLYILHVYIFFSSSLKWFCSFAYWHWYHRKCFLCYCQLPVMNSLMNCLKQHLYWTSRGRWSPSDSGTKTVQGRCSLSVAHIKSDVCNRYTHCLYN